LVLLLLGKSETKLVEQAEKSKWLGGKRLYLVALWLAKKLEKPTKSCQNVARAVN